MRKGIRVRIFYFILGGLSCYGAGLAWAAWTTPSAEEIAATRERLEAAGFTELAPEAHGTVAEAIDAPEGARAVAVIEGAVEATTEPPPALEALSVPVCAPCPPAPDCTSPSVIVEAGPAPAAVPPVSPVATADPGHGDRPPCYLPLRPEDLGGTCRLELARDSRGGRPFARVLWSGVANQWLPDASDYVTVQRGPLEVEAITEAIFTAAEERPRRPWHLSIRAGLSSSPGGILGASWSRRPHFGYWASVLANLDPETVAACTSRGDYDRGLTCETATAAKWAVAAGVEWRF
jgi:hypothetical protein